MAGPVPTCSAFAVSETTPAGVVDGSRDGGPVRPGGDQARVFLREDQVAERPGRGVVLERVEGREQVEIAGGETRPIDQRLRGQLAPPRRLQQAEPTKEGVLAEQASARARCARASTRRSARVPRAGAGR
jgi:hypothetical protein